MIVNKYDKSYDTSDGSEQPSGDRWRRRRPQTPGDTAAPGSPAADGVVAPARAARERWEDDGGPARVPSPSNPLVPPPTPLTPPVSPREFSVKPTWSVRSLRDLNEAVRLGDWPDNPDHARRLAADAERARAASAEIEAERAATRAHAERHRDRNPWEHT